MQAYGLDVKPFEFDVDDDGRASIPLVRGDKDTKWFDDMWAKGLGGQQEFDIVAGTIGSVVDASKDTVVCFTNLSTWNPEK